MAEAEKYQHDHYAFGPLHTTLQAGPGAFYAVFLKIGGVMLLGVLALGAVVGLAMAGAGRGAVNMSDPGSMGFALFAIALVFLAILLAQQVMLGAYLTSRAQNLLWSRTGGVGLQFDSALRLRPLFALTLKNWLLLLLTLGLYWPFAAVAKARMRLEAVSLRLDADPQALADAATPSQGEAAGDAAGDLFGIDIGL